MHAPRPRDRRPLFGERAFHTWLADRLPAGREGLLPLGDDAASLRPPPGMVAVVSTDALVEGTHFLDDSPPARIGAAASGVSLSDIAAKGATPAGVLLALLLPPQTPARWAQDLVRGAEREAARAGAHVVGGDTKPSPVRAVVSTVVGWGIPGRLPRRSGARAGDLLVTTGTVGRGGRAVESLVQGPRRVALSRLLEVRPRVRAGSALGPLVHAMIDTSDGLADASRLVAAASGVRLVVQESVLPFAPGLRGLPGPRRRTVAFYGGDYELLAAISPARWETARRAVRATGTRLTVIGRVERGHGAYLETRGSLVPMPEAGWQPFHVGFRVLG